MSINQNNNIILQHFIAIYKTRNKQGRRIQKRESTRGQTDGRTHPLTDSIHAAFIIDSFGLVLSKAHKRIQPHHAKPAVENKKTALDR